MFLSVVLLGALFLRLVPLRTLDESFTELPTDRGVFDQLSGKRSVLPFLENLFSSRLTQLIVHLIARNYCQKDFGDQLRLSRRNLLTDVSKKIQTNFLLKVGGSGANFREIIFVIQLLEGIIERFHTRFLGKKKPPNLQRDLTFFFACALKILFDVSCIGKEGDKANPFDDGTLSASDGEKSEQIHSSSVPGSTSGSDPTQESVPESAQSESGSPPSTRNARKL